MTAVSRIHSAILKRRDFLRVLGATGVAATFPTLAARSQPVASPDEAHFVFTRLQYDKGDWNADMLTQGMLNGSEVNLLNKLNGPDFDMKAFGGEHAVRPDTQEIFDHPFLYITGHGDVELTEEGRRNIRQILDSGGFLFADNCSGAKNVGFDRAMRNQLQILYPEDPVVPLPMNHPVFSAHYRIDRVQGGDKIIDPYLEGITVGGRTVVIYTNNDLGCAWEGHPCRPGGEAQRVHAFELGVNIVFYALSGL
jgi:hypothetical protein